MNVLDSSAWLAILADEPGASHFVDLLGKPDKLIVPTIVLFEVLRKSLRDRQSEEALEASAMMQKGHIVDFDAGIAVLAVKLHLEHQLPAADSMILATARHYDATLWTMDKDFEGIEGVQYFAKK
jgi:toxin FitB